MSSHCRRTSVRSAAALLAAAASLTAGAAIAQGPPSLPTTQSPPSFVAVTGLFPGGGSPPPLDPVTKIYQGNPEAVVEGAQLFNWYNCSGCHSHGGGGFGPALMDNHWRYGGNLDQIFTSIDQGRPNGMPSWHGKIPDAQIWELAAFVKSLSAPSAANQGAQPHTTPPAPPVAQSPPPAPGPAPVPK